MADRAPGRHFTEAAGASVLATAWLGATFGAAGTLRWPAGWIDVAALVAGVAARRVVTTTARQGGGGRPASVQVVAGLTRIRPRQPYSG